jgi:hypothetical protein
MNEIVLRRYFEGLASVEELAADTEMAFGRDTGSAGVVFSQLRVVTMDDDFEVTSAHVHSLVDAVRGGHLSLPALDAICFCLEASDAFHWDSQTTDGHRVADALFWLGTPEINYPLTPSVLEKIAHYLTTGERLLSAADTRTHRQ